MMIEWNARQKKRWLIGCGGAALLFFLIGVLAFYLVWQRASGLLERFQVEPNSYTRLLEKDTFQPPEDGLISEDDLKEYLAVTEEIRKRLEEDFSKRGKRIDWGKENIGSELVGDFSRIRKIQAEVFKQRKYSPRKFRWITRQLVVVFGGGRLKQYNLLQKTIHADAEEIKPMEELQRIPQENLSLFARYEPQIRQALKLWILGI